MFGDLNIAGVFREDMVASYSIYKKYVYIKYIKH